MNLIQIDPLQDTRWNQLVQEQRSDVFHSPAWFKVLQQTYGFTLRALLCLDEKGQPAGGLSYGVIDDMMDRRIASMPFSDFCDPLITNEAQWSLLLPELLAESCRLSFRVLHNEIPLSDSRLQLTYRAKWHGLNTRHEPNQIWQGFHGAARRAIRKAEKSEVTVRPAEDLSGLRAFFELHLRLRRNKYRLLAQPYRFFEHIWEQFIVPGNGVLLLAYHNDEVIGGVMFLAWQQKLYYKFNASNPEYISLRPNDLVVWHGAQYAYQNGFDYLDFGLSDWDQEGLIRYKRKFATVEKTVSFLKYTPPDSPSVKEKQIRALLPELTALFVQEGVPEQITEQAGSLLYRYFI